MCASGKEKDKVPLAELMERLAEQMAKGACSGPQKMTHPFTYDENVRHLALVPGSSPEQLKLSVSLDEQLNVDAAGPVQVAFALDIYFY